MPTDPYYRSAPAKWLTGTITYRTGLEVVVDPRLEGVLTGRIERTRKILRISPGLDLQILLHACGQTIMHELFGPTAAPSFDRLPRLGGLSFDQVGPPDPGAM